MEIYPQEFIQQLGRQIRRQGHCALTITMADGTAHPVDEHYIESVLFTHENDPLSRRLPTEEAKITLIDFEGQWHPDAPDSLAHNIEPEAEVKIAIGIETDSGETSWGPNLFYYITERPSWGNNRATFTATRKFQTFKEQFIRFPGGNLLMSSLAESVAQSCKLGSQWIGIGTAQSTTPVHGHTTLTDVTCSDAFLLIAAASCGSILPLNSGFVRIADRYNTPVKNPNVIRIDDMYELPISEKLPPVRNENAELVLPPTEHAEYETVLDYESSDIPSVQNRIFARFDTPILPDSFRWVGGMTAHNIASITFHKWRNGIEIEEIVLVDDSIPYHLEAEAIPQTPREEVRTVQIDSDGTEDEDLSNPLLSDKNYLAVAEYRGNYLKNTRSLYSIRYRGDPSIEALDLLRVELPFDGIQTCIVVKATFEFKSGFYGTLMVRKLDTVSAAQTITSAISDTAISDAAISDEEN